jgi:hypothetical protein
MSIKNFSKATKKDAYICHPTTLKKNLFSYEDVCGFNILKVKPVLHRRQAVFLKTTSFWKTTFSKALRIFCSCSARPVVEKPSWWLLRSFKIIFRINLLAAKWKIPNKDRCIMRTTSIRFSDSLQATTWYSNKCIYSKNFRLPVPSPPLLILASKNSSNRIFTSRLETVGTAISISFFSTLKYIVLFPCSVRIHRQGPLANLLMSVYLRWSHMACARWSRSLTILSRFILFTVT